MKREFMVLAFMPLLFNLPACDKESSVASEAKKIIETKASTPCVITTHGIGEIVFADTKSSILKKIPTAKFEKSIDGEGVEWVITTYDDITIFSASNGYDYLEVQNSVCKTSSGASVGMTVLQLEKIYGAVKNVYRNDASSHEEVIFEKSPHNVLFKGYDLGYFLDDEKNTRTTKKINPNGVIEVIAVVK